MKAIGSFGNTYSRGLANQFNRERLKKCKRYGPTDEHGAFTLVGRNPVTGERRKWLAGISAQRGF